MIWYVCGPLSNCRTNWVISRWKRSSSLPILKQIGPTKDIHFKKASSDALLAAVGAVDDRPRCLRFNIVGGHGPPPTASLSFRMLYENRPDFYRPDFYVAQIFIVNREA